SGKTRAVRAALFLARLALERRFGADVGRFAGPGVARGVAVTLRARASTVGRAIPLGMEGAAFAAFAAFGAGVGRLVLVPGLAVAGRACPIGVRPLFPGLAAMRGPAVMRTVVLLPGRFVAGGRAGVFTGLGILLPGLARARRTAVGGTVLVPRLAVGLAARTGAAGGPVLVGGAHGALRFQTGDGGHGNGLADEMLDAADLMALGVHGQRDGLSIPSGPAGAANAVHVVFGLHGQVVIHGMAD